jgi:uncharacterized protein YjbJ (UPF0337 family)
MKNYLTILKGNLNETEGKLKQKLAAFVNSNLLLQEGRQQEELGILQINLGKTKQDLRSFIAIKDHMPGLVKF